MCVSDDMTRELEIDVVVLEVELERLQPMEVELMVVKATLAT